MTDATHTEATCISYDCGTSILVIHEDGSTDGRTLGGTPTRQGGPTEEDRANARLLAAAPTLVDAITEALSQSGYEGFGDPASRGSYVSKVLIEALAQLN